MDFEEGEVEKEVSDAGLPVTQSNDPRSGGHFAWGMSKTPLDKVNTMVPMHAEEIRTYPRPAREGSRVVVHVVAALHVADG